MSNNHDKPTLSDKIYSFNYRRLHWALAGIIIILLLAGQQFNFNLSDAYRINGLRAHSTLGTLSLFIVIAFIFKRFIRRDPTPKPNMPLLKVIAAKGVQYGLYSLALLIPITGLISALYSPHPVYILGLFNIAILTADAEANFSYFRSLHMWATYGAIMLLSAHAGAACYHHFIKKDGVMKSMVGINPRLNKLCYTIRGKLKSFRE